MLDISYAGSALIGKAGKRTPEQVHGRRFAAGHRLGGTGHHLIVFGDTPGLDRLDARWNKLVSIVDAASGSFAAKEAGLPDGGVILVRPDGFVGFCASPVDEAALAALDAHLAAYLVPVRS